VTRLSWHRVRELIQQRLPDGTCFGVPRGGSIVAGLTGRAVERAEDADFIVDDIIDSGATRAKWRKKFPRKPFVALVDKLDRANKLTGWIHFPWENEPDRDAEDNVVRLLQFIGENPRREGLRDTPRRVVKAWKEMTVGYGVDPATVLGTDFDGDGYDQMVICKNIEFHSTCEHHLLPFVGVASVAYIPHKRVVGLSKMARLVDCYARRLQIQEKMTQQIAQTMKQVLKPRGVAVMVEARHLCMSCRGVGKQQSSMVTTALLGLLKQHKAREEFFLQCRR
jgi:GTP cyclohydrolase I